MAENKRQVCSKQQFLKAAIPVLKAHGVAFKKGNKVTQSQAEYWDLIRLVTNLFVAVTAASGANLSLSGVGIYRFSEAGRTPESRSKRFKSKVSSSISRQIQANQDLIQAEPNLMNEANFNEDKFLADVKDVLAALGTAVGPVSSPEIIDASGDEPSQVI